MKVGHSAKPKKTPPTVRVDLTGQTIGKWTVLGFWTRKATINYWLCQCVCGRKHAVNGGNLRGGSSTQCKKCRGAARSLVVTHGFSDSPSYGLWRRMRDQLCDEWRDDPHGTIHFANYTRSR